MKQQPSRLKYRKNHKIGFSFFKLLDKKTFYPLQGLYALQALQAGKLTLKQIEAGRKSIRRSIKKAGKLYIRVFTGRSITSKGHAARMGKGKGVHALWVCPVRKGQLLYELTGVSTDACLKALRNAAVKMPFPSRVVRLVF